MTNEWWRRQIEIERRVLRLTTMTEQAKAKVAQVQGVVQGMASGITGTMLTTGFVPEQNYRWQASRVWWKADYDASVFEKPPAEWVQSTNAHNAATGWAGAEVECPGLPWYLQTPGTWPGSYEYRQAKWPVPLNQSSVISPAFTVYDPVVHNYDPTNASSIFPWGLSFAFQWAWKDGCFYAYPPSYQHPFGIYAKFDGYWSSQTYTIANLFRPIPTVTHAVQPYFQVGVFGTQKIAIDAANPPFYGKPGSLTFAGVAVQKIFYEAGVQNYYNGTFDDPTRPYPQEYLPAALKGKPAGVWVPESAQPYLNGVMQSTPATITVRWE